MKILVAGANGYLGRGVVKKLLDKNIDVVASDISVENIDKRAHIVQGNIFDIDNPYEYYDKPDVVIDLIYRNVYNHYSDTHIEDLLSHYYLTKRFVESGIKMFVGIGTMHEIGFFEGCIKEDTPCNPMTNYGIAKNTTREFTKILCDKNDKKYMWLRGFYTINNSSFGGNVFSKIAKANEEKKTEFPFTTGQNMYDFLDYDDFCEQVACAISQYEILGVINICSGKPEKLADRVERFIKENDFQIRLQYGAFPDRPYDSKIVYGDDCKIRKIIEKAKNE